MGTIGEVFIYLVPVLLGSVVDSFTLQEGTGGIIIALEIGASSLSAIGFSAVFHRLPLRRIGVLAVLIVILCDLTSAFVHTLEVFILLRVLAAFGAGALFAIANALAARTGNPEKTYALIGLVVILAATLGFMLLTYAIQHFGPQFAFAALAALSCLGAPFVWWMPRRLDDTQEASPNLYRLSRQKVAIAMYLGILFLYVGQNAVWVFVERIGGSIGLPLAEISTILILNGFLALLGPFAAHRLGTRVGRVIPILGAMLLQIAMILWLAYSIEQISYGASLIILSLAYVFVIPYMRGVMASLDLSGKLVGASTAIVTVGSALGPAMGGIILNANGSYSSIAWVSAFLFVATLLLVIPVARQVDLRRG
jgi:predicted MFS family arabinose efflux permease